jgi:hypothetical protein
VVVGSQKNNGQGTRSKDKKVGQGMNDKTALLVIDVQTEDTRSDFSRSVNSKEFLGLKTHGW